MRRELIAEVGGEFLNMDGTFRSAGKVMDDSSCLFFVMGQDGKVHTYGAVKSESQKEIYPLVSRCEPPHVAGDVHL